MTTVETEYCTKLKRNILPTHITDTVTPIKVNAINNNNNNNNNNNKIFIWNNKMDANKTTRYPNKNKQVTHKISYTASKIGHREINITKETRRKRAN
jgi:hypothetical protein